MPDFEAHATRAWHRDVIEMQATVGAGYARSLYDFAVASGAPPAARDAALGEASAALSNPETRIETARFCALMAAAKAATGDPALALRFGAQSSFPDMSVVGLIAHASSTMAEAFEQTSRYARLVVDVDSKGATGRFAIVERDGATWLEDRRLNPNDFIELTESTFARFIWNTRRYQGDVPFAISVSVTHPAPAHAPAYSEIYGVPVTFEADWNAIEIHRSWLDIELGNANRYVFGLFSDRAQALMQALQASTTLQGRIEAAMLPKLHTGTTTMTWAARELGMSRSVLYRALRAEGLTFERLLDGLRHRLARDYLASRKLSVNETAYLVGFSDPAAFSRAYKRWTGFSPSEHMSAPADGNR